jgi:hydroxymethylglutaryl-CoA lyase
MRNCDIATESHIMGSSAEVIICECFARDGLQNEDGWIPTDSKVAMISSVAECGFRRVEATSFSNPKLVPAFRDADLVLQRIPRPVGVSYKATCANERAVERALATKASGHAPEELSFLVSASEAHSQRNLNASRELQWQKIARMVDMAGDSFTLVGVISVAFGCPFEGFVPQSVVLDDFARFAELGFSYVTVGDTIGVGNPRKVRELLTAMMGVGGPVPIAHFHDSRGTALLNAWSAYEVGCTYFDSSLGGVGGHPSKVKYGQGVTGNASTEDLTVMFESMGIRTGIDLERMFDASKLSEQLLGRPLRSMTARLAPSFLRELMGR